MKLTISTFIAAITLVFSISAWTPDIPSHGDLWKASHIVLVSNEYELEGNSNQENLPSDWKYKYTRVTVNFKIFEVLKGTYPDMDDDLYLSALIREEKDGAKLPKGELDFGIHKRPFAEMPFSEIQNGLPRRSFYLFLRWDAYGNLEPIDEEYFWIDVSYEH